MSSPVIIDPDTSADGYSFRNVSFKTPFASVLILSTGNSAQQVVLNKFVTAYRRCFFWYRCKRIEFNAIQFLARFNH